MYADYKLLGILKRQFPKVPLLGLTATATSSVLKDCEKILCVKKPITLTASFNRTNLYYEVVTMATHLSATYFIYFMHHVHPPDVHINFLTYHSENQNHLCVFFKKHHRPYCSLSILAYYSKILKSQTLTPHTSNFTFRDTNSLLVSQVRIKDSDNDLSTNDIAVVIKSRYKDQSGTDKKKPHNVSH